MGMYVGYGPATLAPPLAAAWAATDALGLAAPLAAAGAELGGALEGAVLATVAVPPQAASSAAAAALPPTLMNCRRLRSGARSRSLMPGYP